MKLLKTLLLEISIVSLFITATGCTIQCHDCGGPPPPDPPRELVPLSELSLSEFKSCEDYKSYIADSLTDEFTTVFNYAEVALNDTVDFAEDAAVSTGNSGVPDHVSQTNVQVQGVDEADVVKAGADGTLYIANGGFLSIIKAFPPGEMSTLATVVTDIPASELYLDEVNNRLVLIGQHGYDAGGPELALDADYVDVAIPGEAFQGIRVVFFDVSDPRDPVVTQELHIEGSHISSRRIGDRVHLISRYAPNALLQLENEQIWGLADSYHRSGHSDTRRQEIKADIHADVTAQLMDVNAIDLLPKATEHYLGGQRQVTLVTCSSLMHADVSQTISQLVVTSFNTDGRGVGGTAILNTGWITYANLENLYMVQTSSGWWWGSDQAEQSAIHKFLISDEDPLYLASGTVTGWIPDSFALGEHNGFLRVFSHQNQSNSNSLSVLEQRESTLAEIGTIPDFAPNEFLFATRFLGDRGFAVTFRQTDPLFGFDLSDPYHPVMVSELEIPGFSEYIHPIGDRYLLTVGQEGEGVRLTGRMQVQLFDVSDLSNIQKLHSLTPEIGTSNGSWSIAEYDHHAFTYDAATGILALPLAYSDYARGESFAGIVALDIDAETGISELGRVDHSDIARDVYCNAPSNESIQSACEAGDWIWGGAPSRSVVMTSDTSAYLYSVSRIGVKVSDIDDVDFGLSEIRLPTKGYGWWWF